MCSVHEFSRIRSLDAAARENHCATQGADGSNLPLEREKARMSPPPRFRGRETMRAAFGAFGAALFS